jgi:hypothetical protein
LVQSVLGGLTRHAAAIRSGVLSVVGFGLLSAAAFTFTTWAGLVTAGLSCLIIDFAREKPAGPPR